MADYLVKTVEGQELNVKEKIIAAVIDIPKEGEIAGNPLRLKGKIAGNVILVYNKDEIPLGIMPVGRI